MNGNHPIGAENVSLLELMMQQTAGGSAPVDTSNPSVDVSKPETSEPAVVKSAICTDSTNV